MASVEEHYEKLLAQHYTWTRGGFDSSVREYRRVLEGLGLSARPGGKALDLGAGSGFQTAALAGLGFRVVSLDSSEALLRELRQRMEGREVRTVLGDLRDAGAYATEGPFGAAVCMGDTLAHLGSFDEVSTLVGNVHGVLEAGGRLVLEFRDYTAELDGVDRAIPVRLDEDRIMVTFLEYEPLHVNVHDVVFLKHEDGWSTQKSAYKKLRVGTERVVESLEQAGFRVVEAREDRGFSVVVGQA
ncbi:MAG TPA: methyltransferase domain-containing protein [Rubrobacter sp.]|nr:methyltransferase domain-containing protein [Rubrobacter sp.]